MYCSNCGKALNDGEKFCSNCGTEVKNVNIAETKTAFSEQERGSEKIKCPICGSRNLQTVLENDDTVISKGGGYSGAKGCLGYLLFGPFGLLCGNCGSSQKNTVIKNRKLYWVCGDCGHKFRNEEDWQNENEIKSQQNVKVGIMLMALGIISIISSVILMCCGESFLEIGSTGFIFGTVFFTVGGAVLSKATEAADETAENNDSDEKDDK